MDTGTSFALLPNTILDSLGQSISGSQQQATSRDPGQYDYIWQVPCGSSGPSFTLQFSNGGTLALGSVDYVVSLDSTTCVIGFLPTAPENGLGDNALLFGNTFLKKFYTVFDFDNRRIGFTVGKGRTGSVGTAGSGSGSGSGGGSGAAAGTNAARSRVLGGICMVVVVMISML